MQRLRTVWWTWREIGVESSLVQYVCFTDSHCRKRMARWTFCRPEMRQANTYLMPLSRLYGLNLVPFFQTWAFQSS